jgi:hypothetical protein
MLSCWSRAPCGSIGTTTGVPQIVPTCCNAQVGRVWPQGTSAVPALDARHSTLMVLCCDPLAIALAAGFGTAIKQCLKATFGPPLALNGSLLDLQVGRSGYDPVFHPGRSDAARSRGRAAVARGNTKGATMTRHRRCTGRTIHPSQSRRLLSRLLRKPLSPWRPPRLVCRGCAEQRTPRLRLVRLDGIFKTQNG